MEAILEAILGNFMIVIIIIGGIISFLKDKSGKTKQEQQQSGKTYRNPNPVPAPSGRSYQPKRSDMRPAAQEAPAVNTEAAQEQQAEQLKKLARRMNTEVEQTLEKLPYGSKDDSEHPVPKPNQEKVQQHQKLQKRMKRNLTRQGLVDSVIMTEVLGPPRALKSYRTPAAERNRN